MMVKVKAVSVLALCAASLVPSLAAAADPSRPAFSAETRQLGPQGVMGTGRIFVDGDRMRTEISQQGRQIVQIVDGARGVAYTLDPAGKAFMEQSGQVAADQGRRPDLSTDPCAGAPVGTCRKLGTEDLAGRAAIKREISVKDSQGHETRTVQWLDAERGVVLRSEGTDGTRMEMRMVGREKVGSRAAEKWEMAVVRRGGEPTRSLQWYDPELGVAVREEFPGGYSREMSDIRIGEQPAGLFEVPEGYRRLPSGDTRQPQRP